MKGTLGLVVAIALGVVGALCNWLYVHRQAAGFEKINFVMISPNAQINLGDRLKDEHLETVAIPRQYAETLSHVAIKWTDRETIKGLRATRSYRGGELLLQQDLSTPVEKNTSEMLAVDEVAVEVPVDPRTFVSENYKPGDRVYFFAPRYMAAKTNNPLPSVLGDATQIAGPFRILALGSRKSSLEVEQAARKRLAREDVITIGVNFKDKDFDGKEAKALFEILKLTGNQGVQVAKVSARKPS